MAFWPHRELVVEDPETDVNSGFVENVNRYFVRDPAPSKFDPKAYEPRSDSISIPEYLLRRPKTETSFVPHTNFADSDPVRTLTDIFKNAPPPTQLPEPSLVEDGDSMRRTENVDEVIQPPTPEPETQLETPPEPEAPASPWIKFNALDMALRGLAPAVEFAKKARQSAASAKDTLMYMPGIVMVGLQHRSQDQEALPTVENQAEINHDMDPEVEVNRNKKLKVAAKIGLVALAATGAAVGTAYLVSKGYNPHLSSGHKAHEAVQNHLAHAKAPASSTEVPNQPKILNDQSPLRQLITSTKIGSKHIHRAVAAAGQLKNSITIKTGDGYSQAIAKLFPNHSARAYEGGYVAVIKGLGPNILKGIHHYKMANGDWGLSGSGKAKLTQPAMRLLSHYFNSHP